MNHIRVSKLEAVYIQTVWLPDPALTSAQVDTVLGLAARTSNRQRPLLQVETFHGNAACGPYVEFMSVRKRDVEQAVAIVCRKIARITDGVEIRRL